VHGVERAHGLPPARRQARRRHGSGNRYLDNLYEEYGLCVELDGNAAHPALRRCGPSCTATGTRKPRRQQG
jgi:hypothetical protein